MACVVDVSDFGSAAARRAFMTEFTSALYEANTEPLHLVLDEADLWAPQRTQPDGLEVLGRVEEIVRRGRVRGFVPWLITQRPAVLHKDVLSQADILVSMKLTSSQDRAAVGRWIEGQADRAEKRRILGVLPQLQRGQGWVWAPGEGVLAPVSFPRVSIPSTARRPRCAGIGPACCRRWRRSTRRRSHVRWPGLERTGAIERSSRAIVAEPRRGLAERKTVSVGPRPFFRNAG